YALTSPIGLFSFSLLFTISFFFVNFAYPVLIYPIDRDYFPVFQRFYFNEDLISKTTALAYVGYTSFSLGVFSIVSRGRSVSVYVHYNINVLDVVFYILFVVSSILIIFIIGANFEGILTRKTYTFHYYNQSILLAVQCFINLTSI